MTKTESFSARINRLTEAECKRRGWVCDKAEQKVVQGQTLTHNTKDLFNWIDYVALRTLMDPPVIIGIQATSKNNLAARVKKSKPLAQDWISAGGVALAWGFADDDTLTEVDLVKEEP